MSTDTDAARRLRKQQLIDEGAVHRARLTLARRELASNRQSPARSALGGVGGVALQLLQSGALQAVLPLLLGGVAALGRQPRLRRLARNASIAAVVAAAVGFLMRRRRR